jgi:Kef-type K+ transport system membrane component KefB
VAQLTTLIITLGLAIGTAFVQTIMKAISRPDLPNKNHSLTRDDALFWSDWIMAAAIALSTAVIAAANQANTADRVNAAAKRTNGAAVTPMLAAINPHISPTLVIISYITIFFGCTAFPYLLRIFAYDSNGQIKTWGWGALATS